MIPLMNVSRQYESIKEKMDQAISRVLYSGQYVIGQEVMAFEKEFAEYCGVKYAISVGNGTDALEIALKACGIGAGDEVITCAMSFFSTAEAIAAAGATPVFVDCVRNTGLIDTEKIKERITENTKAILPIHLYGQCADMDRINTIAKEYKLKVIEDAAQAAGAAYKGNKAGSIGDVGCISFFPTKNLGAVGDGGIITTNNEEIYRQCMAYRVHGSGLNGLYTFGKINNIEVSEDRVNFGGNHPKYFNYVIGKNSRLDEIQAAILSVKLTYLDEWNSKRREIAEIYDKRINNRTLSKLHVLSENLPIYYVYILSTEKRDDLRTYLQKNEIGSGVYFPLPIHLQVAFKDLGYQKGDMPNSEYIAEHTIAIPMFPELTQKEIEKVIKALNEWEP